ncbi:MAG TPA: T9SS type A sorting domain-containing protein [Bacteroidia bacterium]|nr:T9SS type A sorting domain-containing protein [Bacteroidia bacterium]
MTSIANNGNWSDPTTWSGLRVPANNDTLSITVGLLVRVDIQTPEYANFHLIVDGELSFDVGQKIYMCPGSVYLSPTGKFSDGNPGSKIIDCGNTVWSGPGPTTSSDGTTFGNTTLPVVLISFAGEQLGESVEISWITASESNCSHFTVSRSVDGLPFENIVRLTGSGTTSQPRHYVFQDDAPVTGTNYYKLTQTDFDGVSETFEIIAVKYSPSVPKGVLTFYPNPGYGNCTITLTDAPANGGTTTLEILDATGQIVYTMSPELNSKGGFTVTINADNNLKPGVYIVRSRSANAVYQQKAVIK